MAWLPKQKVIVPFDFSDQSQAAVDTALEMVASPEHVHLIYVLLPLSPLEPGVVWESLSDEDRTAHAERGLRDRLSDPKYAGITMHVTIGDPGHKIVDYASAEKADLIVLPSHGRTGLKRILIGSVAERVVRLAHCPVLVLKT